MNHDNNRDEKGRFVKGNTARCYNPHSKESLKQKKKILISALIDVALSLLRPTETLKQELKKEDSNRLEFLTAQAISKGKTLYIQWLIEMAIGKPRQTIASEDEQGNTVPVKIYLPPNGREAIDE